MGMICKPVNGGTSLETIFGSVAMHELKRPTKSKENTIHRTGFDALFY